MNPHLRAENASNDAGFIENQACQRKVPCNAADVSLCDS